MGLVRPRFCRVWEGSLGFFQQDLGKEFGVGSAGSRKEFGVGSAVFEEGSLRFFSRIWRREFGVGFAGFG